MINRTRVQILEVTTNAKSPICLYGSVIRDTEIISDDACIKEYIPLGTPILLLHLYVLLPGRNKVIFNIQTTRLRQI